VTQPARYRDLFVLVVASLILWWRPLLETWKLALDNDAYTHLLLILPLSAILIYADRQQRPASDRFGSNIGIFLLVFALLLRAFTYWNSSSLSPSDRLSLGMFALVVWWNGSVVVCLGVRTFRLFIFPLCFLLLLVPFPERILDPITDFLQHQSAAGAGALFRIAHIPVTRDGIWLSIPGLDIEVAPECSSIRSSMMLLVITLVLAHLFLSSWWKKAILVIAAIPLSVAKNSLRIFTIGDLGTRVDPAYLTGRLHRQGGVVFLAVAVAIEIGLLWILRKSGDGHSVGAVPG
jgi:exosortase